MSLLSVSSKSGLHHIRRKDVAKHTGMTSMDPGSTAAPLLQNITARTRIPITRRQNLTTHFSISLISAKPTRKTPRAPNFSIATVRHPTHSCSLITTTIHPTTMSSTLPSDTPPPYTDPTSTLVATSALDLLLIELVPMAYRITTDLAAREDAYLHGTKRPLSSDTTRGGREVGREGTATATVVDEEEAREAVFHRLENLGYRVGLGIVER
jgi:hypothetical protein